MKKALKWLLPLLLLVALLCCAGCKEEPAHEHTFSDSWTYDSQYHWHAATCEHTDEKGSLAAHTWGTPNVTKNPTCTVKGSQTLTCSVCGATKTESIAATGHSWELISLDGNGIACFTCKTCSEEKTTSAIPAEIRMVTAGPGEDASESAVISWHSTRSGSYLEYTDADGEEFVNSTLISDCNETLSTADWRDTSGNTAFNDAHYRCKVYLDNLTPGSTYKYRIRQGDTYSDVATFRTAEADTTTFQFMWLSDNHVPKGGTTTLERVRELIAFAQNKDGVDLDFVLFTGDMVNIGKYYPHWNYWSDSGLMNEMTYAFVAGNHDYYDGTRNSDGDKVRETNAYFKDVCAYPANNSAGGKSVLDSNYWFIWNRVLFVCIDNFTSEGIKTRSLDGASLQAQQAWFKAVVVANEGKYDYLIYAQHLPWFNADTNTPCNYGNFNSWYKIFDTYGVDFALSSDEHTYRRTYALYNKKNPSYDNSSDPTVQKAEMVDGKVSKGTVYVVSNLTEGSSISTLKNKAPLGLKYIEYTAGGVGGVYFTVTPTEMTLHLIGAGGTEYDTITVLKKDRSN